MKGGSGGNGEGSGEWVPPCPPPHNIQIKMTLRLKLSSCLIWSVPLNINCFCQFNCRVALKALPTVGYESHDRAAPAGAAAPKIATPEIYFSLPEAQKGIIPNFFRYINCK